MSDSANSIIFRWILKFLTLFFAGLSIIACIGSYYDEQLQLFAFFGLFLPVILIFNFLFFIHWGLKKNKWAFVPIFALIANMEYLGAVFQFPQIIKKEIKVEGNYFKVGTYNVKGLKHGLIPLTVNMISEFMKEKKVDILCLQEFDYNSDYTIDSIVKAFYFLPYSSIIIGEKPGFGLAILSNYPVLHTTRIRFGNEGNQAMSADFIVEGDTIRIFNFHLQTTNFNQTKFPIILGNWFWHLSGEEQKSMVMYESVQSNLSKRNKQAELLRSKINESSYPTLVCGDMNSNPSSYSYHQVKGRLHDGFKTCGSGYEYTFNRFFRLYRIDYIFHSDEFGGIDYDSYDLDFSDHRPVIMEVNLNKIE